MLGGEIYYRAIGRPWGAAADFIITVKLHPLTTLAVGWAIDRRPGPPASGWAFKCWACIAPRCTAAMRRASPRSCPTRRSRARTRLAGLSLPLFLSSLSFSFSLSLVSVCLYHSDRPSPRASVPMAPLAQRYRDYSLIARRGAARNILRFLM